jgi:AmmeMemoRadiSam system protein B
VLAMNAHVRPPAVAGLFYPLDAEALTASVDAMLAAAPRPTGPAPKAIIAPHAGYVYSGPIAAAAYAALAPDRGVIRRVVLLGPAHRVRLTGLALPRAHALRTPLGDVPIDVEGARLALELPYVTVSDIVHEREHSLEVHLPFLQRVLGELSVVPLAVGDASPVEVAAVLERLWGGPETRIVVSSDLSHYLPYPLAKQTDAQTAATLERLQYVDHEQACGASPINGLIAVARGRNMTIERLDLRSSGDTSGGRGEVVGYGAFALSERGS